MKNKKLAKNSRTQAIKKTEQVREWVPNEELEQQS